jgi:hypothetical protein
MTCIKCILVKILQIMENTSNMYKLSNKTVRNLAISLFPSQIQTSIPSFSLFATQNEILLVPQLLMDLLQSLIRVHH